MHFIFHKTIWKEKNFSRYCTHWKLINNQIHYSVGSKASIKKLFFLGPNVEIICPPDATFYQWKKYHNQKMTNIFQDDKRKLNISLKLEDSPTSYECTATTGFDKRTVNITVYILGNFANDCFSIFSICLKIQQIYKLYQEISICIALEDYRQCLHFFLFS